MNIYKETIMQDEGLRLMPYRCSEGKLTIGYGRNIEDRGITSDEAEYLLENDIRKAENCASGLVRSFWRLSDNQKIALVSMVFQMGYNGVSKFKKTIKAINDQDYEKASIEMLDSKWARQTPNRAKRLSKMMKEG